MTRTFDRIRNVVVNLKVIKCMLLVPRVENADMFA